MTQNQRTLQLLDALDNRILVLDGAMGTAIQGKNLVAQDFGGPDLRALALLLGKRCKGVLG